MSKELKKVELGKVKKVELGKDDFILTPEDLDYLEIEELEEYLDTLTEAATNEFKICPKCGKSYKAPSAISRVDNKTQICPTCGTREALESLGIKDDEEIDKIIETILKIEEEYLDTLTEAAPSITSAAYPPIITRIIEAAKVEPFYIFSVTVDNKHVVEELDKRYKENKQEILNAIKDYNTKVFDNLESLANDKLYVKVKNGKYFDEKENMEKIQGRSWIIGESILEAAGLLDTILTGYGILQEDVLTSYKNKDKTQVVDYSDIVDPLKGEYNEVEDNIYFDYRDYDAWVITPDNFLKKDTLSSSEQQKLNDILEGYLKLPEVVKVIQPQKEVKMEAAKIYNQKSADVTIEGLRLLVDLWETNTSTRTTQHCEIVVYNDWKSGQGYPTYKGKSVYYNRSWESFDYELALIDTLQKLAEDYKQLDSSLASLKNYARLIYKTMR